MGSLASFLRVEADDYTPYESESSMASPQGDTTDAGGPDDKMRYMRDADRRGIVSEWRQLAGLADRVLSIVFLLAVVISAASILS